MEPLPAYILAGGKSSRLGQDKALVDISGQPLIGRVASTLAPFASEIVIVAGRGERYGHLGYRVISDRYPDAGPMAGIHAAVADNDRRHRETDGWVLCTACDVVVLHREWIAELLAARDDQSQAIVYRTKRWEPLPGLYHRSLLPAIEEHIAARDLALWKLLERARTRSLKAPESWAQVINVNDQQSLQALTTLHVQKTKNGTE